MQRGPYACTRRRLPTQAFPGVAHSVPCRAQQGDDNAAFPRPSPHVSARPHLARLRHHQAAAVAGVAGHL
ncbi:hypothetical protein DB806_23545, partial [Xanthomonas perforans]